MSVHAVILDGPLPPDDGSPEDAGAGARLRFEGIVRPIEDGREILALNYQTYDPMATEMLRQLAGEMLQLHGLTGIRVEHSRGRVPVGACSFRVTIAAPHRGPALEAMAEFIDRLKRDVPIWKRPIWAG